MKKIHHLKVLFNGRIIFRCIYVLNYYKAIILFCFYQLPTPFQYNCSIENFFFFYISQLLKSFQHDFLSSISSTNAFFPISIFNLLQVFFDFVCPMLSGSLPWSFPRWPSLHSCSYPSFIFSLRTARPNHRSLCPSTRFVIVDILQVISRCSVLYNISIENLINKIWKSTITWRVLAIVRFSSCRYCRFEISHCIYMQLIKFSIKRSTRCFCFTCKMSVNWINILKIAISFNVPKLYYSITTLHWFQDLLNFVTQCLKHYCKGIFCMLFNIFFI